MNIQEFMEEVEAQRTFSENGQRWPHKRLALLLGIRQALQGSRLVRYPEIERALTDLLVRFGPKSRPNPQDPVWRLRHRNGIRTRIWEIANADLVHAGPSDNPRISDLRLHASMGLSQSAAELFAAEPESAFAVARWIAESIVPETLEPELMDAVFGDSSPSPASASTDLMHVSLELVDRKAIVCRRVARDPLFAPRVLSAYDHRCAVCAIAPELDGRGFGLEAAHIRWANHRGPDAVQNGLCLCRMHHVALDRGAMTIDPMMRVRIAPGLNRTEETENAFHRFEARKLRLPRTSVHAPNLEMLEWHHREVFRGEVA